MMQSKKQQMLLFISAYSNTQFLSLPPQQRTGPGKPAAKGGQAYEVALLHMAQFPGFAQRNGYAGSRGVAVLLNVVKHLVVSQLQFLLHKL